MNPDELQINVRANGQLHSLARRMGSLLAKQIFFQEGDGFTLAYATNISHRLPLMYAVVLIDVIALMVTFAGTAPDLLAIWVPLPFLGIVGWRAIYWLPKNVRRRPIRVLDRDLKDLPELGTIISFLAMCWTLSLYSYGSENQQSVVHYMTAVTCFTGILGLGQSPRTAVRMSLVVMVPSSIFFMMFDHPNTPVIVAIQILVTALLVLMTASYHQDFAQLEESRQELERRRLAMEKLAETHRLSSNRDPLTGANNRRQILHLIGEAVAPGTIQRPWLALIDLNGFKHVNDTYGHGVGDAILCETARRIGDVAEVKSYGRMGGDEFAALLSGDLDATEVDLVIRKLGREISRPIEAQDLAIAIKASIGLHQCHTSDVSECLERADAALYKAKAEGSANPSIFSAQDESALQSRREITRVFTSADLGRQLKLVYQPIVDSDTGTPITFESLVRWSPDGLRMLPPAEFICLAEATGRICELTDHVLATALNECRAWQWGCNLAVNLSAHDLLRADTAKRIQKIISEAGAPPSNIVLEITETALISDYFAAAQTLNQFRKMGLRIALDDFGTGQSSLSHVHNLPLDFLKIDKSFACDLVTSQRARAVVSTILALARQLGLECTMEGIETIEQQATARALGIRHMQGFLFGRPQDVATVLARPDVQLAGSAWTRSNPPLLAKSASTTA